MTSSVRVSEAFQAGTTQRRGKEVVNWYWEVHRLELTTVPIALHPLVDVMDCSSKITRILVGNEEGDEVDRIGALYVPERQRTTRQLDEGDVSVKDLSVAEDEEPFLLVASYGNWVKSKRREVLADVLCWLRDQLPAVRAVLLALEEVHDVTARARLLNEGDAVRSLPSWHSQVDRREVDWMGRPQLEGHTSKLRARDRVGRAGTGRAQVALVGLSESVDDGSPGEVGVVQARGRKLDQLPPPHRSLGEGKILEGREHCKVEERAREDQDVHKRSCQHLHQLPVDQQHPAHEQKLINARLRADLNHIVQHGQFTLQRQRDVQLQEETDSLRRDLPQSPRVALRPRVVRRVRCFNRLRADGYPIVTGSGDEVPKVAAMQAEPVDGQQEPGERRLSVGQRDDLGKELHERRGDGAGKLEAVGDDLQHNFVLVEGPW
eukprot:766394-Hanusia_phi.AAC.5